MDRNPLDFPNSARLADFDVNVLRLFDVMPEGWVFCGVMRRAGVEYLPQDDDRWIAIATLESPQALGPVPEVRGAGKDMVGAVVDLRLQLMTTLGIEDETAAF